MRKKKKEKKIDSRIYICKMSCFLGEGRDVIRSIFVFVKKKKKRKKKEEREKINS